MSGDVRVLVVDDHRINRLVLSDLLRALGCVVSVAADGEQALAMAAAGGFDLICLDRHMPGMGGDEVVERLPGDQFVLAWSTDLTDLPKRFNGTLSKPVSIAAVQAAVRRAEAWRLRSAGPGRRGAQTAARFTMHLEWAQGRASSLSRPRALIADTLEDAKLEAAILYACDDAEPEAYRIVKGARRVVYRFPEAHASQRAA